MLSFSRRGWRKEMNESLEGKRRVFRRRIGGVIKTLEQLNAV
jgi:hypothetical protein